ncbi:neurogenic protein mastermind-like [Diaphorina citri]|uniref:Neurogenic protein mastermind-like n=1 Tax=Diaphorina citri TaxID=121845 RepID=A0A1S4E7H4_DIACI|nr:neurogenic protein mastermind-like [Diaphorina citri]
MTEALPPKRQAVVDRLRRRIENYRRHQSDCVPRYDHSFNGLVERDIQETLLLKQKYLESKAKRSKNKPEKKLPSQLDSGLHNASLPVSNRAWFNFLSHYLHT